MNKYTSILIAGTFAALTFAPAHAQETDTVATLQVQGAVMQSEGGEFVSATTGTRVESGDRVMVMENSSVTVNYDTGCDQTMTEAGVYMIDAENCVPGAVVTDAGAISNGTISAAVAVGLVLVPIIDSLTDDDPDSDPTPISR